MTNLRLVGMALIAGTWFLSAGCDGAGGGESTNPVPGDSGAPAPDAVAPPQALTSTQATTVINQHVDDLVTGLANSTGRLDTTGSADPAAGGVGAVLGSASACPSTTPDTSAGVVPSSTTDGLGDLLRDVAKEAQEHVFRPELVEVDDGSQVVYKVDPAVACGSNPSCAQKLTQYPVRFLVTANADGSLNVALLIGEARHNPATAVLGPQRLSLRANLAEVLDVIRLYTDAQDQQDLPERLGGVVAGTIEKRAESDFAISASILEGFDLLVGQAKGKPVAVTVQPTDPAALLTLNSLTNTLGCAANLGAVDVQIAGTAVCDDSCGQSEQTGTFSGHLGGVTSQFTLSQGATELTFSALGLGSDTSFVALNNNRLGTLDVNPNNGRKLSVTFKKTAGGTLVTFDPALDLKLAMMLNKLSESLRVDMPAWLGDEIFDVLLGGDPKPSVLIPAPTCDAYGTPVSKSEVEVVTGTLSLAATSLPTPVTVTAGMCLLPVDSVASDAHPFTQVAAGVCQ
jgi:hypothetical protein